MRTTRSTAGPATMAEAGAAYEYADGGARAPLERPRSSGWLYVSDRRRPDRANTQVVLSSLARPHQGLSRPAGSASSTTDGVSSTTRARLVTEQVTFDARSSCTRQGAGWIMDSRRGRVDPVPAGLPAALLRHRPARRRPGRRSAASPSANSRSARSSAAPPRRILWRRQSDHHYRVGDNAASSLRSNTIGVGTGHRYALTNVFQIRRQLDGHAYNPGVRRGPRFRDRLLPRRRQRRLHHHAMEFVNHFKNFTCSG